MERKGLKLSLAIVFLVLVVFGFSSNTISTSYAAINSSYSEYYSDSDPDNIMDKKIKDSTIIEALAQFLNAISSLVENTITNLFESLTGEPSFPWADRIIFNAVSLLDVNFFNPSNGSFFKQADDDTPVAKIVRSTYFTVLAICIAFLTIVVAIAAVRMALTALASEKAKYKEAITKWMFSIILIFLMHNLMAFIFYVNEGLVEVASSILVKSLDNYNGSALNDLLRSNTDDETIVKNFINLNNGFTSTNENKEAADRLLSDESKSNGTLSVAAEILDSKLYDEEFKYATTNSGTIPLPLEMLWNYVRKITFGDGTDTKFESRYVYVLESLTKKIMDDNHLNELKQEMDKLPDGNPNKDWYEKEIKKEKAIRSKFVNNSGVWTRREKSAINIIGNLASALKENAYTYPTDDKGNVVGWKTSKSSITGAILFGIFIAQSVLYLFSYTKRFFYIVVLAILAPVIVLFDFLGKAIS